MIRSRRVVWPALVSVLVLGGLAGEPDLTVHSVLCISTSMGAVASMSCGDPEFEAEMKANALTPEEAKSIGCPPVQWDDEAKLTPDIPQDPGFPSDEPTYTPRTPDPAVAARVNQAWDRIERWPGAHASATLRKLKFGADPQNLARWEANHGRRLPDADGGADPGEADDRGAAGSLGFGPAPFYELMPAKQIHSEWKMLCDIGPDGYWRDGHLIPFAYAIDGGNLFNDTRTGKTGEFFNEEGLTLEGDVVWPSYLALLKATTRSLETGRPIRGWRPKVVKGALEWESTRSRAR
ncbi:hypothetical protein [Microbispora hainanensis]|uniref:SMI1/KNR4 family protein n=1 Tax=Microbispora hainanensis TaxID=568844 RepID=A0ABZ1SQZ4_9ACTN|nr:hypothetical protein [Microbispora hainanensis]